MNISKWAVRIAWLLGAALSIVFLWQVLFKTYGAPPMAKYGNIMIIRNATQEAILPLTQYLETSHLRYVYQAKTLYYEAKKMSQLDSVEKIASDNDLEYIHIHGHHLPGNYVGSNHLPADSLGMIKAIWAPN